MISKKKQIIISACLGIVLLIVIFLPKSFGDAEDLDEVDVTEPEEVEEIVYKYGIPLRDYTVDYGVVKNGQSLSAILDKHGFAMGQIYEISQKSKEIFDVRKIRVGNGYAFFTQDSITEYFVYEIDPKSYVVYKLKDGYEVTKGEYPVEWKPKTAKGTIRSSLWNAMSECDASPVLSIELSRIFGWTIDFFGIKVNDEFRVLYEQETIDGQELPNLKITGAKFLHGKDVYYAIPFEQDGEILYYNENGNSLEGAFLKAPMDYYRITSRFTNSRYHPILKKSRAHHGVDYAAPVGTPIYSIGDGTVIDRGYQKGGGGNYVKIKHNSTYSSTYMHLQKFAKDIKKGVKVKQKQVIGYVGSTGLSTGPHLDFRVYENGRPVDPLKIKSQPKKPVSKANMQRFIAVRDSIIGSLEAL